MTQLYDEPTNQEKEVNWSTLVGFLFLLNVVALLITVFMQWRTIESLKRQLGIEQSVTIYRCSSNPMPILEN